MTHERTASLVCSHFLPPSLSQMQLMGKILHVRQGEPWCCALQGSWFVFVILCNTNLTWRQVTGYTKKSCTASPAMVVPISSIIGFWDRSAVKT